MLLERNNSSEVENCWESLVSCFSGGSWVNVEVGDIDIEGVSRKKGTWFETGASISWINVKISVIWVVRYTENIAIEDINHWKPLTSYGRNGTITRSCLGTTKEWIGYTRES